MMRMRKKIRGRKNQRGQALVQALIAGVITATVATTVVSMINRQKKAGTEAQMVLKSFELTKRLQQILRDDRYWNATVGGALNAAIGITCHRGAGDCSAYGAGGNLVIYNPDGTVFYNMNTATDGFTAGGDVCSGSGAGYVYPSDKCPYHVNITWQPVNNNHVNDTTACSVASPPCNARISGTFTYLPSSKDRTTAFNAQKYNFAFIRESKTRQDYFVVVDGNKANTTGGGACGGLIPSAFLRDLNTIVADPARLVSGVTAGGQSFILPAGEYYCEVTAPAGPVSHHKAYLQCTSCTHAPAFVGGSSSYYYAPSTVTAKFTCSAACQVSIGHTIDRGSLAAGDTTCMGKPASTGVNEVYTQVRCRKISQ